MKIQGAVEVNVLEGSDVGSRRVLEGDSAEELCGQQLVDFGLGHFWQFY